MQYGAKYVLDTIDDVRRLTNRGLTKRGLVATMFDSRTNHAKEVLRDLLARYELPLIGAPVRKSIRFSESPTGGESLLASGVDVPGAAAYRAIARDLLGMEVPEDLLAEAGWDEGRRTAVLEPDRPADAGDDRVAAAAGPSTTGDLGRDLRSHDDGELGIRELQP